MHEEKWRDEKPEKKGQIHRMGP